jgi:hypothetical protein
MMHPGLLLACALPGGAQQSGEARVSAHVYALAPLRLGAPAQRFTASGITATLGLSAPPAPYRVRVLVEDAGGKTAALNQAVEIPK